MIRMISAILFSGVLALCAQHANSGEAAKRRSAEDQLLKAIRDGDLEDVEIIAATLDLNQVVNLPYHALASPNADVVEFLRDKCDFNISDLQIAAIRGDVMRIRFLLARLDDKSKAEAMAKGYLPSISSHSPLSLAVQNRHANAVRLLIEQGANVNEATHYTLTPLANAAELGHVEIVKFLLEAGVKINQAPDGKTALMMACWGRQPKTAQLLLEVGADPNLKRHDGQRALHFAAKRGNAECVTLLLKHGADIDAVANGKNTALTYAELYKYEDVIAILRKAKPK